MFLDNATDLTSFQPRRILVCQQRQIGDLALNGEKGTGFLAEPEQSLVSICINMLYGCQIDLRVLERHDKLALA